MSDIPDWAFKRMDEQVAAEPRNDHPRYTRVGCAFARYIAAHEEAPVDPRIGVEAINLINLWGSTAGNVFVEACIQRGIELAKSGAA